jgi:hypothetical protein
MPRQLTAAVVAAVMTWSLWGAVVPTAAASATVVTAGSLRITFGDTVHQGVVGAADGYVTLGFSFESGQGGMAGDMQLGENGSNQPTLAGDLAELPATAVLPSAPSAATLPIKAGERLLVYDAAHRYVLVHITRATAQTVSFTYTTETALSTVQAHQGQTKTGGGSQGAPKKQVTAAGKGKRVPMSAPARGQTPGVYAMSGNCIGMSDHGKPVLELGVALTALGAAQGQTVAQAEPGMDLMLDIAILIPKQVRDVSVHQSGTVDGNPWYTPLYPNPEGLNGPGRWTFSLQQTDPKQPYRIMITSSTLAAEGLANPHTGVLELDWTFNTRSGCGR